MREVEQAGAYVTRWQVLGGAPLDEQHDSRPDASKVTSPTWMRHAEQRRATGLAHSRCLPDGARETNTCTTRRTWCSASRVYAVPLESLTPRPRLTETSVRVGRLDALSPVLRHEHVGTARRVYRCELGAHARVTLVEAGSVLTKVAMTMTTTPKHIAHTHLRPRLGASGSFLVLVFFSLPPAVALVALGLDSLGGMMMRWCFEVCCGGFEWV